jgi:hypothetical protein
VSLIRSISDGGGVQSTAQVILATQGRIHFDYALFANVGEDSEHPFTNAYVEHIQFPYLRYHGVVEPVMVQKTIGDQPDTILGKIERTAKSEVIPARSHEDGPPLSRSCTWDFKIETMGKWLKAQGASAENKATVAVGISYDEIGRAGRNARPWEAICYPLCGINTPLPEGFDRPLRRGDCERVIATEPLPRPVGDSLRAFSDEDGLRTFGRLVWGQLKQSGFRRMPVPFPSSCWFCPHHSYDYWQGMRTETPDLFDRACQLEKDLTQKVGAPRFLTRYGIPLRQAINAGVDPLPFPDPHEGGCTTGACAT